MARVRTWWRWTVLCSWLPRLIPSPLIYGVVLRVFGPALSKHRDPDFADLINEWGRRAEGKR